MDWHIIIIFGLLGLILVILLIRRIIWSIQIWAFKKIIRDFLGGSEKKC